MPFAEIINRGRAGADTFARLFDVAQVAVPTRFASMGREHETERAAHSALRKVAERVL